jgi:hypothetical protein
MKPDMARLTLARKIAAIALTLWRKEGRFDAEQRTTGSTSVYCNRVGRAEMRALVAASSLASISFAGV